MKFEEEYIDSFLKSDMDNFSLFLALTPIGSSIRLALYS